MLDQLLELLKQQPKEILQWIVLELMKDGKLSFTDVANTHVKYLEVKEVDLEKEITPSSVENMLCYFGVQSIDDMDSENLAEFARHFYSLGLAQKGEEV